MVILYMLYIIYIILKILFVEIWKYRCQKWESGKPRHKKVAMKAKIIAKKFAQSEIILYLCNIVARMTFGSEICGITIGQIFLSARESVP